MCSSDLNEPPAFATRMSKRPCVRAMVSMTESTSPSVVTSQDRAWTSNPPARNSVAVASQTSRRLPAKYVVAPSYASAEAIARPRCVPPPVTRATDPAMSNMLRTFMIALVLAQASLDSVVPWVVSTNPNCRQPSGYEILCL